MAKNYSDLSGMAALEILHRWCTLELMELRAQDTTDAPIERIVFARVMREIRRMQGLMRPAAETNEENDD